MLLKRASLHRQQEKKSEVDTPVLTYLPLVRAVRVGTRDERRGWLIGTAHLPRVAVCLLALALGTGVQAFLNLKWLGQVQDVTSLRLKERLEQHGVPSRLALLQQRRRICVGLEQGQQVKQVILVSIKVLVSR